MINRRVLVQRCPAVPTAPKTHPINAIERSASFEIITALLPPNSKIVLPKRAATVAANALPMRVEPVADTSGMRWSPLIFSPTALPP